MDNNLHIDVLINFFKFVGSLWVLFKIVSCVFIAGLISTWLGFTGFYWLFLSVIFFSVLMKIIFWGNKFDDFISTCDRLSSDLNNNIDDGIVDYSGEENDDSEEDDDDDGDVEVVGSIWEY